MSIIPPQTLTGYLSKQGHEVRNWKRRFFVLESGRISYYVKSSERNEPPFGIDMRGTMTLDNVIIQFDDRPGGESGDVNKIYLINEITGVDLLLAASDHEECVLWKSLIVKHVEFANRYPAEIIPPEVDDSKANRRFSLYSILNKSISRPEQGLKYPRSNSENGQLIETTADKLPKQPSRRVSLAARIDISAASSLQDTKASETPVGRPVPEFTNPDAPRHAVNLKVERPTGCNILSAPNSSASVLRRLAFGDSVQAIGRIVDADAKDFYRLRDGGFLAIRSDNNQRIVRHVGVGSPAQVHILKLTISEVQEWRFFGLFSNDSYRTDFILEVTYGGSGRGTVTRLQRSFRELELLERAVAKLSATWRWVHAPDGNYGFPVVTDGVADLLESPENILRLQDVMGLWLSEVLRIVDKNKCKELRHFITPRERDCVLMDNDLAAENGLNGAWGVVLVNATL